jgi:WD40 repeat protein
MGDAVDTRMFGTTELRDQLRHWAFDDLHTTNELHNELVSFQALTAVEFSRDGKHIAVAGTERLQQVTLWDAEKCTRTAVLPHAADVFGLGFSPDGIKLVTAGGIDTEPQLLLWTLGEKLDVVELEGPLGELRYAAFSPDGKWIAAGGIDKTLWVWNAADLEAKPTQIDVKGNIHRVRFSADGQFLAVSTDTAASVFSVPQFEPAFAFVSPGGTRIWDVALAGNNLVCGGDPHFLAKCAFDDSKPLQYRIRTDTFQRRLATRVDVSPDGKLIAAAISDATVPKQPEKSRVDIYDLESGDLLGGYPAHHERTTGLRFSPDGTKLATVSWDGTLQIANLPPLDANSESQNTRSNMRRSVKTGQP